MRVPSRRAVVRSTVGVAESSSEDDPTSRTEEDTSLAIELLLAAEEALASLGGPPSTVPTLVIVSGEGARCY